MKNNTLKQKMLSAAMAALLVFPVNCLPVLAEEAVSEDASEAALKESEPPQIPGLTYEASMELEYAQYFDVYEYTEGYKVLDLNQGADYYLIVPEGKEVPQGLDESITVLEMPLDTVYLTATSAMSLYDALGAMDQIRLSGTQANGWYIESATQAMNDGDILFAGKYDEPDYELLISEGCDLAIESTMIFHSPKVKEMLEDLGIPVLVAYATYEPHPLGRAEYLKLFGVLTGKEEEADAKFQEQKKLVEDMGDFENTGKTVAYFYVSTDGKIVVRDSKDYIAQMIDMAGGKYIYSDLVNTESTLSTVNMTMEEFYSNAIDADYLVYNAAIDNPITSVEELTAKNPLFGDFKAVKEGNVWCSGKYLYQATNMMGNAIMDFHLMLTDGDPSEMTFLTKVN